MWKGAAVILNINATPINTTPVISPLEDASDNSDNPATNKAICPKLVEPVIP